MNDSEPELPIENHDAAKERSLVDDLRALADDAQAAARAEYVFQKSRAFHAGREFKRAAIFTALAVACAILALIALTVGAVLALTPHLTAWGATGVVVLVLLLAAGLFALIAAKRLRQTAKTLEGGE